MLHCEKKLEEKKKKQELHGKQEIRKKIRYIKESFYKVNLPFDILKKALLNALLNDDDFSLFVMLFHYLKNLA